MVDFRSTVDNHAEWSTLRSQVNSCIREVVMLFYIKASQIHARIWMRLDMLGKTIGRAVTNVLEPTGRNVAWLFGRGCDAGVTSTPFSSN
jgi:hypothetical protein